MWLHAWACTLSKLDHDLRGGAKRTKDLIAIKAAAVYFMAMAETEIHRCHHDLFKNDDEPMRVAAQAALKYSETLPNDCFAIPEASPNARGTGRAPPADGIKQFPGQE